MIQELLGGGAGLIGGERKITMNGSNGGVILEGITTHSPSPSPSPSSSNTTTTTPTTSSTSENQNLRCPRCDSSNTKFCYYNNYNLTQPRHFCKTCRRYWTKGGALRNVPIGGGCRKNKNTSIVPTSSSSPVGKSSLAGKAVKSATTTLSASDIINGKSAGGLIGSGFDHHHHHHHEQISSNPILWASPQNSHLLALLRATTQNPNNHNPNPISNSVTVKEEAGGVMLGSHMSTSESALNGRTLGHGHGQDPLSQVPSIGLCSSFWRNNQHQTQQNHHQYHQQQQQQNGFILGEVQNSSGIQELYQRLRSSANYYSATDHSSPVVLSNVVASSSSSSILESAPVAGAELGYWNPAYSWSDLPTTNGAYP